MNSHSFTTNAHQVEHVSGRGCVQKRPSGALAVGHRRTRAARVSPAAAPHVFRPGLAEGGWIPAERRVCHVHEDRR